MTPKEAEVSRLAKECDTVNHILETLDPYGRNGYVAISADTFDSLVEVLNRYLLQSVVRLHKR